MTHPKDVAVPALPEPYRSLERCLSHPVMRQVLFAPGDYFTADQMNDHARTAILADRAAGRAAAGVQGEAKVEQTAIVEYTPGDWFKAASAEQMRAFFLSRLPAIRKAAQDCGYAIGVHGSERRDFDLIAVPWRDECDAPDALARALAIASCGLTRQGGYEWEAKPRGRIATSIPICWCERWADDMAGAGHIDLSVMDAASTSTASIASQGARPDAEWYRRKIAEAGDMDCGAGPSDLAAPKEEGEAVTHDQALALWGLGDMPFGDFCERVGCILGAPIAAPTTKD